MSEGRETPSLGVNAAELLGAAIVDRVLERSLPDANRVGPDRPRASDGPTGIAAALGEGVADAS